MEPLRRLIAPNPGPFTGEGTNSWLVGQDRLVLIDPGPDLEAHAEALKAAAGTRVEAILVTHAHRDHSGLAPRLAADWGVPVWAAADPHGGRAVTGGAGVDHAFRPDHALEDGAVLDLAGMRFAALHTPGHLGGHFCFALGDRLFSGDHVMGWSTSVVTPPEGDMAAYRRSLARLAQRPWACFLPGHGPEITEPAARLAALIAHRTAREAQVLEALRDGAARAVDLVARIYPGLGPDLIPAAEGNVLAHLLELRDAGRIRADAAGQSPGAESLFSLRPSPQAPV